VNEPLTAKVVAPFDPDRRVAGLARHARSSGDETVWTFQLRSGVRFQDGSPFNSAAVQANALRWQTTAAGRAALPALLAVDAPRPDEVRFVLSAPDPSFPRTLSAPELGIVSPDALQPSSGEGAVVSRLLETGTGPFEIRERSSSGVLLARNTAWWAAALRADLGPALDQIEFRTESSSALRLAMLDAGEAQLADELERNEADQAERDPLLSILKGPGQTLLGIERSVRGVDSGQDVPSLSAAWLTDVNVPG
jgi:peptide/nickel transport system substrate-binding protein